MFPQGRMPRLRGTEATPIVSNKTPATKAERVESEPRFGANIGGYSGRSQLLSGASELHHLVLLSHKFYCLPEGFRPVYFTHRYLTANISSMNDRVFPNQDRI